MIRILVVGLGAVGSVYAAALARGGADVSVFVRPKHAASAHRRTIVHVSGTRGLPSERREIFRPTRVLTDVAEVGRGRFDQVWLCLPTPAMDDPTIAEVVKRAAAPTCVGIAPRLVADEENGADAHAFVQAIVGFLSFTRARPDGLGDETVVFDPPLSPSRFGGEPSRARAAVEALRRGSRPAAVVDDAHATLAFSSATLMPVVAAIEANGWKFAALGDRGMDRIAARAVSEACAVTEARLGRSRPALSHLVFGSGLRLALSMAPLAVPFDVEAFVEAHFVKVRSQTRRLFAEWLEVADAEKLEAPSLVALANEIGAV